MYKAKIVIRTQSNFIHTSSSRSDSEESDANGSEAESPLSFLDDESESGLDASELELPPGVTLPGTKQEAEDSETSTLPAEPLEYNPPIQEFILLYVDDRWILDDASKAKIEEESSLDLVFGNALEYQ